ncbi:GNAT family N-acetyltransferase [Chloroflexota bacterium]
MNEITIQKALKEDAPAIHELHIRSARELCKNHYTSEQLSGWLDHRTSEGYLPKIGEGISFVARKGSEIVGIGVAIPQQVEAIFVSPDHIKQGIGSILLKHAIDMANKGGDTITLESTMNAVGFYKSRGFTEVKQILIKRGNVELPAVLMEYKTT